VATSPREAGIKRPLHRVGSRDHFSRKDRTQEPTSQERRDSGGPFSRISRTQEAASPRETGLKRPLL
jgi:hypothetical protein